MMSQCRWRVVVGALVAIFTTYNLLVWLPVSLWQQHTAPPPQSPGWYINSGPVDGTGTGSEHGQSHWTFSPTATAESGSADTNALTAPSRLATAPRPHRRNAYDADSSLSLMMTPGSLSAVSARDNRITSASPTWKEVAITVSPIVINKTAVLAAVSEPTHTSRKTDAVADTSTAATNVKTVQVGACPPPPLLTVNGGGRLGNKLCQYFTLWSLHHSNFTNANVWIAPNMADEFARQFVGQRSISRLPSRCRPKKLHPVSMGNIESGLRADRAVCIGGGVCDVAGFARHRSRLLAEFPWQPDLAAVAAKRLEAAGRRHGCNATNCTFIGVHMRSTDYAAWLKHRIGGRPVGTEFFQCALSLCRQRYTGAVFVVASDDPKWARINILGEDVALAADLVPAGKLASRAAALDMATLSFCNHTIVSYGTFSYMAAFMAGGDIVAPTGYSTNEHFVTDSMIRSGWPLTLLHYRTCQQVPLDERTPFTGMKLQIACDMGKLR